MPSPTFDAFAATIAARIDAERYALAARWLDRLVALIPVGPNDVFPTETLLDHIPKLIEQIAKFLAAPENEIASDSFVVGEARELGELRHQQKASVHQLLREYELLRNILGTFVGEEARRLRLDPDYEQVLLALQRIDRAVALLTQTTVNTFVERYTATIEEQTRQLKAFNQMVSHELRQPLAALQMASTLLRRTEGDSDEERARRLVIAVERNVTRLAELVTTITKMTAGNVADESKPGTQRVSLTMVAQEASRQLRDMAASRDVRVVVAPDLPEVTVDVGRLELILTNLLSNAIKYADPAKSDRFVEVLPVRSDESGSGFQVRDNGLGMTVEQLKRVFTPFFRAHANLEQTHHIEGLGLGLSIVRDCVDAIGASIDVVAAPNEGTTFTVTLPVKTAS
jgi:signal transduction histidine kinase